MSKEIIEIEAGPRQTSLRDLYYIFFRHKWKLILVFLAVVVIVAVFTFSAADIYRSEAKLLVLIGRESVTLDPTATTGPIIAVGRSLESEVNTEMEILKSRENAENVVNSIGPEAFQVGKAEAPSNLLERLGVSVPLSGRDRAVLSVIENLDVEVVEGSRGSSSKIIGVSYEAQSPKLAQQVLTKLIDSYMEKHIAVHRTPGSYQFFTEQVGQSRSKLEQSEKELENLKSQTGISSLAEQRGVILDRIGTLQTEIDSAEAALASSNAKVQSLQQNLADTPELVVTGTTVGLPNAAVDAMRATLYGMQLTEQDLVSKFEPDSRQVQDVRRQIAAAQALLDREQQQRSTVTRGLNTNYMEMQSTLLTEQTNVSSLNAQVETLKKMLVDAEAKLKVLTDSEGKITALTREIEIQEANYRKYSENLEQARIDNALENEKISNINLVQPATLPIKPVGPHKARNLLVGFLVGIFLSIAIALFSEYLDHSIKTPEEVEERLLLPTLACIPKVRTSRISSAENWDIPVRIREHYESLKEQLLLGQKGSKKEPRVLAIAGSHDDEGASTVAANLAATLARLGDGQVLLIDADLRHPSVHQIFESRLSPGLTDILANGHSIEGVIVPSPVKNLHILSTGTIDGNLSEIFDSDAFIDLFKSIKKDYRFVVIDLPAVNEASWAVRLARLSDGVGLVVEAGRSRWEVVQRTKELLAQSNANVIGVVINKRRFYIPRWLYRTL